MFWKIAKSMQIDKMNNSNVLLQRFSFGEGKGGKHLNLLNSKYIIAQNKQNLTLVSNNIVHWDNYAHRDGLW